MRLLGTARPELPAPVQRNLGVWLALGLIVAIVGLSGLPEVMRVTGGQPR
jgi:hypothetical protein